MSLSALPHGVSLHEGLREDRRPARGLHVPAAAQRHMSVLVVEDDPSQALLLRLMLERMEIHVTHARHGALAVDAVKQRRFSLVLMDYRMPVLDGVAAAAQIREWEALMGQGPQPIVAVTACAMMDERQRCMEAGMDDILLKPFSVESLVSLIGRYAPVQSTAFVAASAAVFPGPSVAPHSRRFSS